VVEEVVALAWVVVAWALKPPGDAVVVEEAPPPLPPPPLTPPPLALAAVIRPALPPSRLPCPSVVVEVVAAVVVEVVALASVVDSVLRPCGPLADAVVVVAAPLTPLPLPLMRPSISLFFSFQFIFQKPFTIFFTAFSLSFYFILVHFQIILCFQFRSNSHKTLLISV
jgi:hypothetical protein